MSKKGDAISHVTTGNYRDAKGRREVGLTNFLGENLTNEHEILKCQKTCTSRSINGRLPAFPFCSLSD